MSEKPDVTVTTGDLYKGSDRSSNISDLKMQLPQGDGSYDLVSFNVFYKFKSVRRNLWHFIIRNSQLFYLSFLQYSLYKKKYINIVVATACFQRSLFDFNIDRMFATIDDCL